MNQSSDGLPEVAEARSSQHKHTKKWLIVLLVVPPVCFYFLLFNSLTSLPLFDDYNSVFEFLLRWKQETDLNHLWEIFTFQHNEYRLIFENAVFGLQYAILGHANLTALSVIGDLLVIPLFGVLYLMWRSGTLPGRLGLVTLVPVSWLLFQLEYASTLNNAMGPLQNIAVILFVLLSLYYATAAHPPWAFSASLMCMALSVASSGNGLLLIPVGGIMLAQRKELKRFLTWMATAVFICCAYFYKYNFNVSRTHVDHSLLSSFQHISPAFAAAFLGSVGAKANPVPAIVLGILLASIFAYATYDKLLVRNPAVYYSGLFFLITAVAVSGLRSDAGFATSITGRYRINSTIMVILMYLHVAEKLPPLRITKSVLCWIGVALVAFNLAADYGGYTVLLRRRARLDAAMLRWEHHQPKPVGQDEEMRYYEPEEPVLSEAIEAGIYPRPTAANH
jgi:hypothetical protein